MVRVKLNVIRRKILVTLKTNYGDIVIELDFANTPETAENFLNYAKNGFYDNTIFHRVINNFMIQCGGFDSSMQQKTTQSPINNEANKNQPQANKKGTIAMARTSDPHSATAQFFINVKDNHFLDFTSESSNGWGYCVFGKVTQGMEVVDQIKAVTTTTRSGHQDVPENNVIIEQVIISD